MSCDVFGRTEANKVFSQKTLWMFGDSNMRSNYKDLVWLLENGTLVPLNSLKKKNENSHANDQKLSRGTLHAGRNYEEVREYRGRQGQRVKFTFITRLFSDNFVKCFEEALASPDYVVINSCVWDLSRWGPDGVVAFKKNLVSTLEYLTKKLPSTTRVIFYTTLPLDPKCTGGFLKKEVNFMRVMLPWHIIEANNYIATQAKAYKYDVLDLHYHLRFFIDQWEHDGIHWSPMAYRFVTNLLLTHITLCEGKALPGVVTLDKTILERTQILLEEENSAAGVQGSFKNSEEKPQTVTNPSFVGQQGGNSQAVIKPPTENSRSILRGARRGWNSRTKYYRNFTVTR